jgi:hypothetical protein
MNEQQRRAKRAQAYGRRERACDHGIGHPGGPTGWRQPRKGVTGGAAAMLRRLRKKHPELHKRVLAGELSTYQAAVMAGFRRGWQPKPVIVSQIPPMGGIAIAITPQQEMELWLGPSHHHGSAFSDDDERRRLWCEHRDRLMRWFAHDGRRPQAWWEFEAPFKYPGFQPGEIGALGGRALGRRRSSQLRK